MANYDSIDLLMDEDGDIVIGPEGDIQGTQEDQIISLQQKILSVLKSDIGDWLDYPTISANLQSFVGKANTRENAQRIERAIQNALVNSDIVRSEDLEVNVHAAGIHSVFIEITVRATPTIFNSIDDQYVLGLFFSSTDGNILWATAPSGGI